MTGVSRRACVKWIVALTVLACGASDVLALKYVVPYPKDKRGAVEFKVTEENDGTLEFEVVIDEKKIGEQVVNFEVSAYTKSENGKRIGVNFSTRTTPLKDGKLFTRFTLDRELASRASAEFALTPFPGDGKGVPGGTFYAFQLRDFVDFSPEPKVNPEAGQFAPDVRRRIANYERAYQEQTRVASEKDLIPRVRPIRRSE
ncbi:MAG: hypothetical protein U0941_24765 [Planctomycetaceae bacterium]